jgi:hypothetical protein
MSNPITTLRYNRFKDAPWFSKEEVYCLIGGAGGISSWLTLFLARANFTPIVYDFDRLEEHNLGGQFFPSSGIGKPKVEILQEVVKQFAYKSITIFNQRFDSKSLAHNIMFSGFDNMQARKEMFELWVDYVTHVIPNDSNEAIYIDGRLLAEQMQILCIRGNDTEAIEKYRAKYLFDDNEVADGPCSFRQTSHAAAIIAGLMTGFFTNHMSNVAEKNTSRQVPFYTEYYIPLNMFI